TLARGDGVWLRAGLSCGNEVALAYLACRDAGGHVLDVAVDPGALDDDGEAGEGLGVHGDPDRASAVPAIHLDLGVGSRVVRWCRCRDEPPGGANGAGWGEVDNGL